MDGRNRYKKHSTQYKIPDRSSSTPLNCLHFGMKGGQNNYGNSEIEHESVLEDLDLLLGSCGGSNKSIPSDDEGLASLQQQLSTVKKIREEHDRKDLLITMLRKEVSDAEESAETIKELNEKIAKLEDNVEAVENRAAELDGLFNEHICNYEMEKDGYLSEIEELRARLKLQSEEINEHVERVKDLESKLKLALEASMAVQNTALAENKAQSQEREEMMIVMKSINREVDVWKEKFEKEHEMTLTIQSDLAVALQRASELEIFLKRSEEARDCLRIDMQNVIYRAEKAEVQLAEFVLSIPLLERLDVVERHRLELKHDLSVKIGELNEANVALFNAELRQEADKKLASRCTNLEKELKLSHENEEKLNDEISALKSAIKNLNLWTEQNVSTMNWLLDTLSNDLDQMGYVVMADNNFLNLEPLFSIFIVETENTDGVRQNKIRVMIHRLAREMQRAVHAITLERSRAAASYEMQAKLQQDQISLKQEADVANERAQGLSLKIDSHLGEIRTQVVKLQESKRKERNLQKEIESMRSDISTLTAFLHSITDSIEVKNKDLFCKQDLNSRPIETSKLILDVSNAIDGLKRKLLGVEEENSSSKQREGAIEEQLRTFTEHLNESNAVMKKLKRELIAAKEEAKRAIEEGNMIKLQLEVSQNENQQIRNNYMSKNSIEFSALTMVLRMIPPLLHRCSQLQHEKIQVLLTFQFLKLMCNRHSDRIQSICNDVNQLSSALWDENNMAIIDFQSLKKKISLRSAVIGVLAANRMIRLGKIGDKRRASRALFPLVLAPESDLVELDHNHLRKIISPNQPADDTAICSALLKYIYREDILHERFSQDVPLLEKLVSARKVYYSARTGEVRDQFDILNLGLTRVRTGITQLARRSAKLEYQVKVSVDNEKEHVIKCQQQKKKLLMAERQLRETFATLESYRKEINRLGEKLNSSVPKDSLDKVREELSSVNREYNTSKKMLEAAQASIEQMKLQHKKVLADVQHKKYIAERESKLRLELQEELIKLRCYVQSSESKGRELQDETRRQTRELRRFKSHQI